MSKRIKLKGTTIFFNNDMVKDMQLIYENLTTIQKQVNQQGSKTMISKDRLLVNKISYTIQEMLADQLKNLVQSGITKKKMFSDQKNCFFGYTLG